MRRSLAAATAVALVLVGAAAGTSNAKPRREKVEREDSAGYVGGRGSGADAEVYVDEAVFETESYEREVSVEINDRSGQATAALVRQDTDGDGTWDLEEAICGATAEPVRIQGGSPVVVKVQPGPCADGTPAVMTSGSVAATFAGYVKRAPSVTPSFCKPAKPRAITETYQSPAGVGAGENSYPFILFETSESEAAGGASFHAACSEGRMEVTLADKSGLPTRAAVGIDPDGAGPAAEQLVAEVCGGTEEPIEIVPGAAVNVYVVGGPCADGTPAAATTGTITATFLAP